MSCGCESYACPHGQNNLPCPNKTDESSPTMPYVGKVCIECATRIRNNGDGWLILDKGDKS